MDILDPQKFQLIEPRDAAGQGGLRRYFLARNRRTGELLAVTLLDQRYSADLQLVKELRYGVEAYKTFLSREGFMEEVDCNDIDGWFVVTNNYVPGAATLKHFLDRGYVFTERELQCIGSNVAAALAEAEQRTVSFGNLSPRTILYDPNHERAYLVALPRPPAEGATLLDVAKSIGEPYYQAPEALLGGARSASTDLYGLCMVLYTLCMGRHPFRHTSDVSDACLMVVNDPVPPLPPDAGLSPALAKILERGLEKQPHQRCSSPTAFLSELRRLQPQDRAIVPDSRVIKLATSHYPRPIAHHFHQFNTLTDDGLRFQQLESATLATLQLLAAIVLGELRARYKDESCFQEKLKKPTTGIWVEVAREGSRALRDERSHLTCPEVYDLFFRRSGKVADGAKLLNDLAAWRNQCAHSATSDLEGLNHSLSSGEKIFGEVLRSLAFLTKYCLIHVDSLLYNGGQFTTNIWRLSGIGIEKAQVSVDHPLECGKVLFAKEGLERSVSLYDTVLFRACPQCKQEDLFFYQSERGSSRHYFAFHRGHTLELPVQGLETHHVSPRAG